MIGSLAIALLASAPAKAARPPAAPPKAAPVAPPTVVTCPEQGAGPAGCVDPPLKDRIKLFTAWSPEVEDERTAAGIIRAPRNLADYREEIPLDLFPPQLHRGELDMFADVDFRLTIGPDDAVLDCRVTLIQVGEGPRQQTKAQLAPDPAIGETACRLVRLHGKFLHAIDMAGRPVEAPLMMTMTFERLRFEPRMLPPAPSPPSRWVGKRPYDRGSWPPHTFYGFPPISLQPPRWNDFLAGRKDLPKQAKVGVVLDYDKDGSPSGCKIGKSSGDAALDAATCAALETTHNESRTYAGVRGYPAEVRWKRNKVELVWPGREMFPAMIAPIPIAEADIPEGPIPEDTIRLHIQVDPSGKFQSCRIDSTWGSTDAFDARGCALVAQRAKFTGAVDGFGEPAIGGLNVGVDWKKRTIEMWRGWF